MDQLSKKCISWKRCGVDFLMGLEQFNGKFLSIRDVDDAIVQKLTVERKVLQETLSLIEAGVMLEGMGDPPLTRDLLRRAIENYDSSIKKLLGAEATPED